MTVQYILPTDGSLGEMCPCLIFSCPIPISLSSTLHCGFTVVYSTDRSKAVIPVFVLLFVALWFILRGNLFYVLPCVILFLCFSVLLALRLPRLGKRELILVLFVRLFDLCMFGFVDFLFLLVSGKGCGLWLWHFLDFSLTFFFRTCTQVSSPVSKSEITRLIHVVRLFLHKSPGMLLLSLLSVQMRYPPYTNFLR